MKRFLVVLALIALAFATLACGGASDVENGGDNGGDNGGGGGTAEAITVTITDTGLTVDTNTLADGAVAVNVVNQTATPRSVYIIPGSTPAAELPMLPNGSVDVLNPPPTGVKVSGSVDNVPAMGTRSKNIVVLPGPAPRYPSNGPGDVAAGYILPLTVNPK